MTALRRLAALTRRSPIRYVLPVLLLFDLVLVFSRGMPWRGQWLWTLDWSGAAILLVGPLSAGLVAWHTGFQRHVFDGWQGVGRKPYRAVGAILVTDLVLIELVHAAAVIVAVLATASANPIPDITALHGVLQFCVLAGYVAVGYVVGRLWPSPVAPPILAIALYLVPAMAGLPTLWVSYGGATSSLSGFTPEWWVDAAQALVGVALLVLALQIGFGRPSRIHLIVGALAAVMLLFALSILATTGSQRFESAQSAHVCSSGRPVVCVNDDIRFKLGEATSVLRAIDGLEQRLGVSGQPDAYVQVTPGAKPTFRPDAREVRYFGLSSSAFGDRSQFAYEVLAQALIDQQCLEAENPRPWSFESLEVAANVIAFRLTRSPDLREIPQVDSALSLPRAELDTWLREVLQAANDCSLRSVPPLPGTGA